MLTCSGRGRINVCACVEAAVMARFAAGLVFDGVVAAGTVCVSVVDRVVGRSGAGGVAHGAFM